MPGDPTTEIDHADGTTDRDATAGGAVGATVAGLQASATHAARVVGGVMKEIRPSRARNLVADAARVLADRGPTGKDGAFGQVSGKVHEVLAAAVHNHTPANLVRGAKVVLHPDPQSPIVDATRMVRGRSHHAISYKKSAGGAARAALKTPPEVAIAVPADEVASAAAIVGSRITSSGVTRGTVDATTERGLRALAANGTAGSLARAAGRAGLVGAATAASLGAASDYVRHVRKGEMSWTRFTLERSADGVEGAIGAAAGFGASTGAAAAIAGTTVSAGVVLPVVIPVAAALGAAVAAGAVTKRVRRAVSASIDPVPSTRPVLS